jgi:hypothetical protein
MDIRKITHPSLAAFTLMGLLVTGGLEPSGAQRNCPVDSLPTSYNPIRMSPLCEHSGAICTRPWPPAIGE